MRLPPLRSEWTSLRGESLSRSVSAYCSLYLPLYSSVRPTSLEEKNPFFFPSSLPGFVSAPAIIKCIQKKEFCLIAPQLQARYRGTKFCLLYNCLFIVCASNLSQTPCPHLWGFIIFALKSSPCTPHSLGGSGKGSILVKGFTRSFAPLDKQAGSFPYRSSGGLSVSLTPLSPPRSLKNGRIYRSMARKKRA